MTVIYALLAFALRKLTTAGAATVILTRILLRFPNVLYACNQTLLYLFQRFLDAKAAQ